MTSYSRLFSLIFLFISLASAADAARLPIGEESSSRSSGGGFFITQEIQLSPAEVSPSALFNVILTIPDESLTVIPGEEALFYVDIYKIEAINITNITGHIILLDNQNNTLYSDEDGLLIEDKLSLRKEVPIPQEAESGQYRVRAYIDHESEFLAGAIGSIQVDSPVPLRASILFLLLLLITLIISLSIMKYRKKRRHKIIKPG